MRSRCARQRQHNSIEPGHAGTLALTDIVPTEANSSKPMGIYNLLFLNHGGPGGGQSFAFRSETLSLEPRSRAVWSLQRRIDVTL